MHFHIIAFFVHKNNQILYIRFSWNYDLIYNYNFQTRQINNFIIVSVINWIQYMTLNLIIFLVITYLYWWISRVVLKHLYIIPIVISIWKQFFSLHVIHHDAILSWRYIIIYFLFFIILLQRGAPRFGNFSVPGVRYSFDARATLLKVSGLGSTYFYNRGQLLWLEPTKKKILNEKKKIII